MKYVLKNWNFKQINVVIKFKLKFTADCWYGMTIKKICTSIGDKVVAFILHDWYNVMSRREALFRLILNSLLSN